MTEFESGIKESYIRSKHKYPQDNPMSRPKSLIGLTATANAFFVVLLVLKSVVSDFHAKSVVSDFHADHAGNFRFFFVVFVFCVGEINRK